MRKSRNAATLWHCCTWGDAWLCEDEIRSGRNAVVTLPPRERELLFRLSYLLPYEDEIRSVEGRG